MAAPLITRTPIHDDDGSGTTGTIIDNAWKQEFYGQIDADVAAVVAAMPVVPPSNVIYKANGVYATAPGAIIDSVVIPALAVVDTLRVVIALHQAAQAGVDLILLSQFDSTLIRLDDIAGGSLAAGARGIFDITLRRDPSVALAMNILAVGGVGASFPSGIRMACPVTTTSNWLNGGWTLALFTDGQTAGGSLTWAWSVVKV